MAKAFLILCWCRLLLVTTNLIVVDAAAAAAAADGDGDCGRDYPGDGYCDPECNTKAYNWDEGDCCPGTCEDNIYECGLNGYDCRSSGFQLTKPYKAFTFELHCEKDGNGYPTRFHYELGTDVHNYKRVKSFHLDKTLDDACQQKSAGSYKHSDCPNSGGNRKTNPHCFDRGHIVMADHMDSDPITMYEANVMTNILPQAAGFNQGGGAWLHTEKLIECTRDNELIASQTVFGGMIYDDDTNDYFLSSHGIPTPDYFWKVVIRNYKQNNKNWMTAAAAPAAAPTTSDVIAWIMPNAYDSTSDKLNKRFDDYGEGGGFLISISQLQQIVDDPMPELPSDFRESAFDAGRTWPIPVCKKESSLTPIPSSDEEF
jgi:endonuclease G